MATRRPRQHPPAIRRALPLLLALAAVLFLAAGCGSSSNTTLRLAEQDGRASPLLSHLLAPLFALQSRIAALTPGLRHGSTKTSAVAGANSAAGQIGSQSAAAGQPVSDITPTSLAS